MEEAAARKQAQREKRVEGEASPDPGRKKTKSIVSKRDRMLTERAL